MSRILFFIERTSDERNIETLIPLFLNINLFQVCVLEARLEEVQSQNSMLETQYITAREGLSVMGCEVTRLEEDAAKRGHLDEEVARLESELRRATDHSTSLEKTLRDKDGEVQRLLQEKDEVTEERGQVEAEMLQMSKETVQLKDALTCTREENNQLTTDFRCLVEEKQRAEVMLEQMVAEKQEAESALKLLVQKAQLDVPLKLLTEEKSQLEEKLRLFTCQTSELEAKLSQAVEEKLQLETRTSDVLEENRQLQSSVERGTQDKLQLQASVEVHQKEVASLTEERECLRGALLRLQEQLQKETPERYDVRSWKRAPRSAPSSSCHF